jgi:hypothetical protein
MDFDKLSPTLIASVFALLGVLVTVAAQSVALRRQIAGEERKGRFGILLAFAAELEEHRLAAYSEICSMLSDAVKHIDYPDMFTEALDLSDLERKLCSLDSKYSILFSSLSGDSSMKLRDQLRQIVRERTTLQAEHLVTQPAWVEELRHALIDLEVALRLDLGVYAVEFAEIERGFKKYARSSHARSQAEQGESGGGAVPANPGLKRTDTALSRGPAA